MNCVYLQKQKAESVFKGICNYNDKYIIALCMQVSTYFFMSSISKGYATSFEDYFERFRAGYAVYGDHFQHLLGYWAHRDKPNFLFVKYEDILKNSYVEIERIAKFIGKNFTPEEMQKLVHATSHDSMKTNPGTSMASESWLDHTVNQFVRMN
jgi:hypothetical protein